MTLNGEYVRATEYEKSLPHERRPYAGVVLALKLRYLGIYNLPSIRPPFSSRTHSIDGEKANSIQTTWDSVC